MMIFILMLAAVSAAPAASTPATTDPAAQAPIHSAPEAAPPADLASLLEEAARNNPGIAAALSRKTAAEATPSQLEAPSDPLVSFSYTNVGLTHFSLGDDEDSMLWLTWSQELPYPGKLRLAGETGRGEIEVARRRLEQTRLDVAAKVKQAYAELYHADRSTLILGDSRRLLTTFVETARARYETGQGLLQDVLKAQTEVGGLDARVEELVEERRVAVARLNTLAGREIDSPIGLALSMPDTVVSPDPSSIEAAALERSPGILEQEAAVRRDESRLELAKLQLKPDFMWGAGYGYRGDFDPEIAGSFGVRLPLFRDRRQAQAVTQTSQGVEVAKRELESRRLELIAETRRWIARVARAESLERLYREAVIPQARSSLESASAAHGVGKVEFLTLLSGFGTLLDYELDYVTQHHDRVLALAELERLTAEELIDTSTPGTAVAP